MRSSERLRAVLLSLCIGLAVETQAREQPKIEIVPQIPHSLMVWSVAFSPDGRQVLSGGWDNSLKLWDAASGNLVRTFHGHSDQVWSIAFSPDGKQALSGSKDKTVRLWDVATGRLVRPFDGHSDWVRSVTFSPDGKRVLSGSVDKTVKLWDQETGALRLTFEGHSLSVDSVAFSPDGEQVLSGGGHEIKLWSAGSGQLLRKFAEHSSWVSSVVFSPDGKQVLSGGGHEIKLWDAASGELVRTFAGQSEGVNSVAFSPDGTQVLSGSGNTLKLWDTASGRLVRTLEGHLETVHSVAFAPNGKQVLSGGGDDIIKLRDLVSEELIRFGGDSKPVISATFSPDAKQVLSSSQDGTARLWDAASGRLVRDFASVGQATFSPDGKYVLSGSQDRKIRLWDAASGRSIRTFEGHVDNAVVAFSRDGKRVLSGSADGRVSLWGAESGQLLHTFQGHSLSVNAVAFSPDDEEVLSGSSDRTVKIWDATTEELVLGLPGHSAEVFSVAFSPNGRQVLSGSTDKTVKLWDRETGALRHTFEGHSDWVFSVTFSHDGKQGLSGSKDKTVKLWDASSGEVARSFVGHADLVTSVAFSRDGKRVLSGSADSTIRLWRTDTGELVATLLGSSSGEWLAMTPEGFFAASPKGSDLLGIVRGREVASLEQMHQSLYNPDLVREKLADDPDGEVAKAAAVVNLEKVLDSGEVPDVQIVSELEGDLVEAEATITDTGGGIGRIEWRVNGVTAGVETPSKDLGKAITVKRQLALDPGENAIEVVAYNGRNLLASLPAHATVTWQGAPDSAKGRLYVLAIGVDAYSDKKFAPLRLAVKDAKEVGAALYAAGQAEYANVVVKTELDEEATPAKLEQAIDDLARKITPRDTFILFAAGHGISEDGRFYLIPYGYDSDAPGTLADKAIGQDRLQDWVANRIKARKVLILIDTCQSGALVGGATTSRIDVPASEAAVGRLHEATGRPVLTAAPSGKAALEGCKGHGMFTSALLDALQYGDSNGNGRIELSELAAHVQELVPSLNLQTCRERGALTTPMSENTGRFAAYRQSARFGSGGENFVVGRPLR